MKTTNPVLARYDTSIFEVMSRLASVHDAINLGQGFPEDGAPPDVIAKAADALLHESNQYPPMLGLPALRQAVAAHDKRFYGIDVDWRTGVMVTSGATEALAATLLALLAPGDEAVVLAPLYDAYVPLIELAGARARPLSLLAPSWELPGQALDDAFNEKTKLVVINTPMNPTGKVFTRAELERIAALARRHDCYVVCDEVYEHLVYDAAAHLPLMTLPDMAERSLRIGSAGKTFSLTGWKVGYVTAATTLIERLARAHQFLVFATPPNLQWAVAYGLQQDMAYFTSLRDAMARKRDRFVSGATKLGLVVLPVQGTYFANVDLRASGIELSDEAFCRAITQEARVSAIPLSGFYAQRDVTHLARFCFAKADATLDEALLRLGAYMRRVKR